MNRVLRLGDAVATRTVDCRHDLSAEITNRNMKPRSSLAISLRFQALTTTQRLRKMQTRHADAD